MTEIDEAYAGLGEIQPGRSAGGSVHEDPAGGYVVEPFLSQSIMMTLEDVSNLRSVCRVVPITSGDSFKEVEDRGTDNAASWVSETESRPETSLAPLATKEYPVHELYANPRLTQKLMVDMHVDLVAWLSDKNGEAFGKSENLAFVTGFGVLQPRGFLDYTAVTTDDDTRAWSEVQYVPSGAAGAFAGTNPGDVMFDCVSKVGHPLQATRGG